MKAQVTYCSVRATSIIAALMYTHSHVCLREYHPEHFFNSRMTHYTALETVFAAQRCS